MKLLIFLFGAIIGMYIGLVVCVWTIPPLKLEDDSTGFLNGLEISNGTQMFPSKVQIQ